MRSFAAILLGISFIAVAFFGFTLFLHSGDHQSDACLSAVAKGAVCSTDSSPFAFLTFHFNILRTFSEALLNAFAWTAALFAAGLAVLYIRLVPMEDPVRDYVGAPMYIADLAPQPLKHKRLYWFTLTRHEMPRPSFSAAYHR